VALAQTARVVLRWREVPGASGYELQIAKDSGFLEVVLQTRITVSAYRWEHLPTSTHWWRVRSVDAEGRPSEWSQPKTVAVESNVPTPTSPANEAFLPCGNAVELTFETGSPTQRLEVELSASKNFAPARSVTGPGPSVSLGVVSPGVWFWRARAVDFQGRLSEPSVVRSFTVRPATPKPKTTTDVGLGVPSATLAWTEVPCAVGYVVEASSDGREKVSFSTTSSSVVFKPNEVGEVRWRVAARDVTGASSEWSALASFRVRLPAPVLKSESSTPLKLDLAWAPVIGASQYRVEVAAAPDFKQLVASGNTAASQFRVPNVAPGRVYWRVTARDEQGHTSLPSEVRQVDVVAPEPLPPVGWRTPSGDTIVPEGGAVELAWTAIPQATSYEVELDGMASVVPIPTKVLTGLPPGAHAVRVRAKGEFGRVSAFTPPIEVFVGMPKVESAEVTVFGEDVQVVLKDKRGRILSATPTLSVARGRIGAPQMTSTGSIARWWPPADGEDTLTIKEREFIATVELETALLPMWSVAFRAGGIFNFSSVASPTATFGLIWRLPVVQRRLALEARVGVYQSQRTVDFGIERVFSRAWILPVSLLLAWHQPIGPWMVRGGVGPAFQVAALEVGDAREARIIGDFELALGFGRRLGPGFLELEVSGLFGGIDSPIAKLSAGGLGVRIGYLFDLVGSNL
jgi:hypothetical protein